MLAAVAAFFGLFLKDMLSLRNLEGWCDQQHSLFCSEALSGCNWQLYRHCWGEGVRFCSSSIVLKLHDKVEVLDPSYHKELRFQLQSLYHINKTNCSCLEHRAAEKLRIPKARCLRYNYFAYLEKEDFLWFEIQLFLCIVAICSHDP